MKASSRSSGWLTQNRNVRSALLVVVTFALVFLIALGTNRSLAHVGTPEGAEGVRLTFTVLYSSLLGLMTIGLFLLVYLLLSGGVRWGKDETPERVGEQRFPWWVHVLALLFVLALLASVTVAIIFLRGSGEEVPASLGAPATSPPLVSGGQLADPGSAAAAKWSFLGVLAVGALVGVVLLVLRRRRTPLPASPVMVRPERQELREVVEASLDELEHEPDARRAVIRAYVSMERVLAEHGLGRRPYEAPVEYLTRWLASLGVSQSAGERLTGLFQRARFSTHAVDLQMKRDALEALLAFRNELAGEGA